MNVRCSVRGKNRETKSCFCLCGKWLPFDGNTIQKNHTQSPCEPSHTLLPNSSSKPRARIGTALYWIVLERIVAFSGTSRYSSWVQKKQRNQRSHCQHSLDHKGREFQKNIYLCFIEYAKDFDCVDYNKLQKTLKEMGVPDCLTCLLRKLYAGQEATVRILYRTTD